ncbi:MAG TPA: hypothetical protein VIK95_03715 [Egibacteraceae bacterium]
MVTYELTRLGVVMTPDPDDPREAWGVLNPASARTPDGELWLYPRLVAEGNCSRVGLARVRVDDDGTPVGVERLGVVLEPEEHWETHAGGGGVEDPRITHLPELDRWVMTYTAYGPLGARIGMATSDDLRHWERLGPVTFAYEPRWRTDFNLYSNKDALWFPEPVPGPDGQPSYALLHRPVWDLSWVREGEGDVVPDGVADPRPGIWVSYVPADAVRRDVRALTHVGGHRPVAVPEQPWEELKIGGGTPPVRTPEGWLSIFHGVAGEMVPGTDLQPKVRYCAGVMVHDPQDVSRLLHRSASPLLEPELAEEREGIVPNVVFPTAIDMRDDSTGHVFYGMADSRIGVARLVIRR